MARQITHGFKVPRLRRYATHVSHDRLDDYGGDVGVFGEDLFERGDVVEGKCERVRGERCGNAGAVGQPERSDAGSRFDEQTVSVAVITTFKLHQLRASGETACEADGRHRRFRTATHHAHHLDGRDRVDHFLRELDLQFGRRTKTRTFRG